jgi:succinate-semialdehyde dehydrogenase/glutarate-semialdehyde dehydrogenase
MAVIISPNTGAVIGQWTPDTGARIEAVLDGLPRAMAELASPETRRAIPSRAIIALDRAREPLAAIIVAEVGKTPSEAADEVDYAQGFLQHALTQAPDATQGTGERRLRIVPAGPVLAITPYNDPLAGIVRKIAPAIAAGCPVVVKPSGLGHLTAQTLFDALSDAVPTGLVSMVNNTDRDVLDRLLAHPRFRVLSFTGSTPTGLAIAARAGLKRLVLELGGNNPFLVLEGADLDRAAADAVARKTRAAGQACSAQNRIYVVASLFNAFRTRFLDRLSAVTFGASDGGVTMGPVRSARDLDRLGALAAGGQAFGACPAPAPFAFGPVVLDDDAPLRHVEAFGPLVSLCPVPDRTAALALAAQEEQALVCYLYGEVSSAELAPLRFGSLGINSTRIQGAEVPTGGFRTAGIGREGGAWGLQEFQTTINERWGA